MLNDIANRLLMSEDLKGLVPSLEDDNIARYDDAFVIAALEIRHAGEIIPIAGSLIGISYDTAVKIDMRVESSVAYDLVTGLATGEVYTCDAYQLLLGSRQVRLTGPFRVSCPKMLDFDKDRKMCTLAVDLFRED